MRIKIYCRIILLIPWSFWQWTWVVWLFVSKVVSSCTTFFSICEFLHNDSLCWILLNTLPRFLHWHCCGMLGPLPLYSGTLFPNNAVWSGGSVSLLCTCSRCLYFSAKKVVCSSSHCSFLLGISLWGLKWNHFYLFSSFSSETIHQSLGEWFNHARDCPNKSITSQEKKCCFIINLWKRYSR